MARRSSDKDLTDRAVADLAAVLSDAGFRVERSGARRVTVSFDGTPVEFDVVQVAYGTDIRIVEVLEHHGAGARAPVLVADRITADARARLTESGWGWLDRRGHVYLRAPGVLVDADVAVPGRAEPTKNEPIRGAAGLAVAYRLLSEPDTPVSPTRTSLGWAPSTVSEALSAIRDAGLVDDDGLAVVPELFGSSPSAGHRNGRGSRPSPTSTRATFTTSKTTDGVSAGRWPPRSSGRRSYRPRRPPTSTCPARSRSRSRRGDTAWRLMQPSRPRPSRSRRFETSWCNDARRSHVGRLPRRLLLRSISPRTGPGVGRSSKTGARPNVSGEPIVILAGAQAERLVRAVVKLAGVKVGQFALIGGVAVSARLGQAHRATADVDAVVEDTTPPVIERLLDVPGVEADPSGAHRVVVEGVKVETQTTMPIEPSQLDGLTEQQVLYVSAHRYALETASAVVLVAGPADLQAPVTIATAGALVATKLHAIENRRPAVGIDKRAGDAWDLYRLLLDLDRGAAVRNELAAAPARLRRVVNDAAARIFVERAARTASWLRAGDDRMAAIAAAELTAVGQPLVDALHT